MKPRIALVAVLFAVAGIAGAQPAKKKTTTPPTPPPVLGFRAEFLANLDEVQEKVLELAEITPAEKFSWRPARGVRSISEVYMHIAGGNYYLATFLGAETKRTGADLERNVTKKADVIAELKRSFDHLRATVNRSTNLEKQVKMYGRTTTHRAVLLTMLTHVHEHLGQSVAYARMNGVAPPWSR